MPIFRPDQLVSESNPVEGSNEPNQTLWISEAGALTQFGAFIEVLQPGCRSSINDRWVCQLSPSVDKWRIKQHIFVAIISCLSLVWILGMMLIIEELI
jgi:hypothetical protein